MAIINNAHPGSHIPTLQLIDELLNNIKSKNSEATIPESKLLGSAMPEALYLKEDSEGEFNLNQNAQKKMRESLSFWGKYGLWEVSVSEKEKTYSAVNPLCNSSNLPKRIIDIISEQYIKDGELIIPLNDYFKDDALSKDFSLFVLSMCFFLYQEDLTFGKNTPFTVLEAYELMVSSVIPDAAKITYNKSNEGLGVINFGCLLGLLEAIGNETVVPDPTRFIQWHLSNIFESTTEMSLQELLDELNSILPIFDTGAYQVELPQYLNTKRPELVSRSGNVRLSSSMSLALFRLESMNVLRLEARSDSSRRFELTLPKTTITEVTHIRFNKVQHK
ncbi:protein DpdG [Vibrio breoganii]|uniref:protein DpdG n=1 Tax=Vibrio breoganii TaxID=553239 RepID=UPI0021C3FEFA|nr:protein DpdG [Vibrio breoganii]MDN3716549.1 protein DpdG [Vibrio breoganii]